MDNIPRELYNRMSYISIIDNAISELEIGLEIHPDTVKDLEDVGINPKRFIEQFQKEVH